MMRLIPLILLLPLWAQAQDTGAPPAVVVSATRDPVDKSYRKMIAGMDLFQREQARLAPGATLRFRLLPRLPHAKLDGVKLRVVGDHFTLPVALAPDHGFTLERNEQALREDAALIANRKTSSMTWRAEVRSPGVPEGMRRLGDLRLECLVGVEAGLLSNNSRLFAWLGDWLRSPQQVCGAADGNYLFFTERPLFGVTLEHGGRRAALPLRMLYAGGTQTPATLPYCDCQVLLERSYYAPLWDQRWPDDTLLSFQYMDDRPAANGLSPGLASAAQLRAALGQGAVQRFDNGYQVWRYTYPPARPAPPAPGGAPETAELVVLIGPDGAALQARRREPDGEP
ncbi:hypothetical protein ACLB1G_23300 [Oxalobacteraceae bacterium A2-2]